MQDSLFPDAVPAPLASVLPSRRRAGGVEAATPSARLLALGEALPATLRLGTSSWNYPGWVGSVWAQDYAEATLSKKGLRAYVRHPLLRTVSLDRAFYRPLDAGRYAAYAAQVPDDFRFVVKAPSVVADALIRGEDGRGLEPNPNFLDPKLAVHAYAAPALEGLGRKLGALVFQLSPLPEALLHDRAALLRRLAAMLRALPDLRATAPDAVLAVEVRNAAWLGPDFVAVLRECGATYCLGLHAKMPPIAEQLPILRALWPGPLVCRWNLHRRHGAYGYEEAKRLYGAFDRIVDADPQTRATLARVIKGTAAAGWPAYVTIGNKAEGSAPLSALALAEAVVALP
ncbi:DUF72 domain-containing protein [Solimonas variicoloris]|uniref:DUF72 domain-containing protein n=1 Tax=Solimonas variicoloris TaxID=254408 RepID=UPI00035F634C|nr:DUF72 domain-containing protein [Solimonas variicoloris]